MNDDQRRPDGGHRQLFEEAVAGLDPATANRLRLMRRQALGANLAQPSRRLVPIATFAALALALGLGWRVAGPEAARVEAVPADADLGVDLASEEDAALYAWLGEAPVAADGESL